MTEDQIFLRNVRSLVSDPTTYWIAADLVARLLKMLEEERANAILLSGRGQVVLWKVYEQARSELYGDE